MAEKVPMRALLRARETESEDGDPPGTELEGDDAYQPAPRSLLRLRCFACEGSGKLWVSDAIRPGGRFARCVACHGTGRVDVK
jgi:hypothetical protein